MEGEDSRLKTYGLRIAFVAAALAPLLLWSTGRLGVSEEWTWGTIDLNAYALFKAAAVFSLGAGMLFGIDRLADRVESTRSFAVALAVVTAAGFVWLLAAQWTVPGVQGLARWPWILHEPGPSGYFAEAKRGVGSAPDFPANYLEFVRDGDYLHQGTHPPGLILGYRLLISAVDAFPVLIDLSEGLRSGYQAEAYDVLRETNPVVTRADAAVLWWAAVITQLLAAAAAVPLALLLASSVPRGNAVRGAMLWPLVPALAIFLPKSDCLLPLFGLTTAALWQRAWNRNAPASALVAGAVSGFGLWVSLALLPVYAGVVLASAVAVARDREWRPKVVLVAAGAFGVGMTVGVAYGLGADLPSIWVENLRNHAAFYDHNTRTYFPWLLVNILEWAFAAGVPLALAALIGLWRGGWAGRLADDSHSLAASLLAAGVLTVWGGLWLSGKNMGEAARLWIVLDPWLVVAAASRRSSHVRWLAWSLLVASLLTVLRVDGFSLAAMAG